MKPLVSLWCGTRPLPETDRKSAQPRKQFSVNSINQGESKKESGPIVRKNQGSPKFPSRISVNKLRGSDISDVKITRGDIVTKTVTTTTTSTTSTTTITTTTTTTTTTTKTTPITAKTTYLSTTELSSTTGKYSSSIEQSISTLALETASLCLTTAVSSFIELILFHYSGGGGGWPDQYSQSIFWSWWWVFRPYRERARRSGRFQSWNPAGVIQN